MCRVDIYLSLSSLDYTSLSLSLCSRCGAVVWVAAEQQLLWQVVKRLVQLRSSLFPSLDADLTCETKTDQHSTHGLEFRE